MSPTSPRSSEEPAGQMSGREKFTLMGMFLLLILLIGAVVSSMTIFGGTSKTTENEGSAVDRPTPTDLPEPDALLAASPEGDEEDPPLVAPPAPAPEPLTVEFRQQMQAALQSVEDGTAAIGGTASPMAWLRSRCWVRWIRSGRFRSFVRFAMRCSRCPMTSAGNRWRWLSRLRSPCCRPRGVPSSRRFLPSVGAIRRQPGKPMS